MKRILIITLITIGIASCSKVDCDCFISYLPFDDAHGYGYHATLEDVDEEQCSNADSEIWTKEMTNLVNLLETQDIDYTLSCEPI
ncbi:MAG: hypothetical protein LBR17_02625 [Bacteroidales bacterium]|jgi:hypothetical protein|nr:hypothetical protein [Bacteroidales bacterium]